METDVRVLHEQINSMSSELDVASSKNHDYREMISKHLNMSRDNWMSFIRTYDSEDDDNDCTELMVHLVYFNLHAGSIVTAAALSRLERVKSEILIEIQGNIRSCVAEALSEGKVH